MAAPSFVDAGTGATDAAGNWSYTCQASGATGRIFIVQILQDGSTTGAVAQTGQSNILNLAGAGGWTLLASEQPVGSPTAALQSLYIGRATGTIAPAISGTNSTSEDLYIRSYQFTDVSTGTTLAAVIENGTAGNVVNSVGTSATTGEIGAVTTLDADRLALHFTAINDDNPQNVLGGTEQFSELVAEYAEASGTDGSIGLWGLTVTTARTTGTTNYSWTDSDAWGVIQFALIGTTVTYMPRHPAHDHGSVTVA